MTRQALVIEDDADIRALVAFKLRQADFEVAEEGDGEAGLAAATSIEPDVILLDWMMPKLSGIEVLLRLRATESTASIPVIMLTARAQESEIERGFAAGADDYIVKPFSPRELQSRVEAVLNRAMHS
ncbi:MAG: response regulator [Actinomycetia bacterium]|nr:response regulator [Actinomycetes bacterium]MCP4224535.1 response regulator [Actinomycetes bacterium]MCP5035756.1 response regulator [Actinomycetes bacterium]